MKRLKTAAMINTKDLLYKTKQHRIEAYISNLIDGMEASHDINADFYYTEDNYIIFKVTSNPIKMYINNITVDRTLKQITTTDTKSEIGEIFLNILQSKFNPVNMFFYNR